MYPSGELARLAERKALLQARIAVHRWECAAAAAELSRPIALIDRGLELWQRVSPFVKLFGVPAGFMLTRLFKGRSVTSGKVGKLRAIIAVLPMVVRGVKYLRAMAR